MKVIFKMNNCEIEMEADQFTRFMAELAKSVLSNNQNWNKFLEDSKFELVYAGM